MIAPACACLPGRLLARLLFSTLSPPATHLPFLTTLLLRAGTGKTVLACAVAGAAGGRFLVVNGPEVVSEYFGESEAGLRAVFAAAAALAPAVRRPPLGRHTSGAGRALRKLEPWLLSHRQPAQRPPALMCRRSSPRPSPIPRA